MNALIILSIILNVILGITTFTRIRSNAYANNIGEWWDREQFIMYMIACGIPFLNLAMLADAIIERDKIEHKG